MKIPEILPDATLDLLSSIYPSLLWTVSTKKPFPIDSTNLGCASEQKFVTNFEYQKEKFNKGPFKYYVIMILTTSFPIPIPIPMTWRHHFLIPTHLFIDLFLSLINKAEIRQGLFLLKKKLHTNSGSFFQKKKFSHLN